MAESTDAPTPADTGYVLNFPTDGTSFSVRENLVDILERELLGPIHGEEELLPFSPDPPIVILGDGSRRC